jgi:hypothetical protein
MTEHASGDFVFYRLTENEDAPEEIGLVLRTSSNEKKDGSTDDFVELIGPFTKILVPDDHCRKFNEPEKEDPNEVVGGSSGEVGGVGRGKPNKVTETRGNK